MRVGFFGRLFVGRVDDDGAESIGSSSSGKPDGTSDGAGGGVPFLGDGASGWPDSDEARLVGTNGWADAVRRDLTGPDDDEGDESMTSTEREIGVESSG